jgi:hypothetical protein
VGAPANRVRFGALPPEDRAALATAFRTVKRWQARAAYHYQARD